MKKPRPKPRKARVVKPQAVWCVVYRQDGRLAGREAHTNRKHAEKDVRDFEAIGEWTKAVRYQPAPRRRRFGGEDQSGGQ